MPEYKNIFANNLKFYMDNSKTTRHELAAILNVPYTTVCNWLQGTRYPRIERIEELAKYFDVDVKCLVENHAKLKDETAEKINRLPIHQRKIVLDLIDSFLNEQSIQE